MASEFFYSTSTTEISKEIGEYVRLDTRSLPPRSKVFAAVAKMQKFDGLPELVSLEEFEAASFEARVVVDRGIASTKSATASIYAKELVAGPMYPGTLSIYGNGIYFAEPSLPIKEVKLGFPTVSHIASDHAAGSDEFGAGVIMRACLKEGATTGECDDLKQLFRENKARAHRCGIEDLGTFAASMGFDAYYIDGCYHHTSERVWIVVNRSALIFQKSALRVTKRTAIID